jgi:hypothetical protein
VWIGINLAFWELGMVRIVIQVPKIEINFERIALAI